ncbi:aldo/keto reductase [Rhodococcus sp. BP-316]|uniref:aldo/keto reductase n=1 Tax=unclassified Rhodococcus (in: high G+C Gram-positive bacteria) TaxID=192944 RepID=UPI001C9A3F59|nr:MULTISPECIES: aldo/keto reductase [unclassified Rhodococcus (in: high G+C Gram-positive bacteria)]MBY6677247.1 aldo/keto reductase [Rhodococcus sp. BP-332]MBY6680238.1 aldo/keto reductase [Rhodococcus sp. BP-316]
MTRIGTSDLDVFPLALGANTFGWTSDEPDSHRIIEAFLGAGGSLIDTADSYSAFAPGNSGGESETVIGNWFTSTGRRDDVVLATKVSQHPQFKGLAAGTVAAAADASLQRLQTDRIDLYYAHFDDADTPLEETVAAFDSLVKAGKVRYVGISNYTAERARQWIDIAQREGFDAPVALQPHYNLVHRRSYEPELMEVAEKNLLGVFPYFALASGFLTGKYRTREDIEGTPRAAMTSGYFSDAGLEVVGALADIADAHGSAIPTVALAWLLSRNGIVAPIASASRLEQLASLTDASTLSLTADELDRLTALSDKVGE